MAEHLAEQIGYDYEAAVEKCKKKQLRREHEDDVGEDGLTQLIKRDFRNAEKQKSVNEGGYDESDHEISRK